MAETTTIYVTTDVETHGIRKVEAVRTGGGRWKDIATNACFFSSQAYASLPEAIADAEKRRAKKIASLEKQIATIKDLDLSTAVEG